MSLSAPVIRAVTPEDLDDLLRISISTFLDTFAASNTPENMQRYLDGNLTAARLQQELAVPGSAFFFILVEGTLAGYLKVNTGAAQTEALGDSSLEVERIYIAKDHKGLGLGRLLMDKAFALAKEQGHNLLWLGVWEHNEAAIAFYRKLGLAPFDTHAFYLGEDKQTDILMKIALS
ncbi:GNAT family N-acetyltransferase [Taibaiella koreensis]|uniref:GNAT family N-acetyltransferase n=1 Tax=Taibaiella koreensis TaxID=1268548 RepID=UPI000E59ED74|nr:GNAT family N-acetyltransferase [Taibaiella koreensis]